MPTECSPTVQEWTCIRHSVCSLIVCVLLWKMCVLMSRFNQKDFYYLFNSIWLCTSCNVFWPLNFLCLLLALPYCLFPNLPGDRWKAKFQAKIYRPLSLVYHTCRGGAPNLKPTFEQQLCLKRSKCWLLAGVSHYLHQWCACGMVSPGDLKAYEGGWILTQLLQSMKCPHYSRGLFP